MRKTNVPEPLATILYTYCNVNAMTEHWVDSLKIGIRHSESQGRLFRSQLANAILHRSITPDDYERLTEEDFDSQDDLQAWLRELWPQLHPYTPLPSKVKTYDAFVDYLNQYDPEEQDWPEYAYEEADSALASWFSIEDWSRLKSDWAAQSHNWQLLLAGLIPEIEPSGSFNPISKAISVDMMLSNDSDVSAEAAVHFWFYAKSKPHELENLERRSDLFARLSSVVLECSGRYENEIREFLSAIRGGE